MDGRTEGRTDWGKKGNGHTGGLTIIRTGEKRKETEVTDYLNPVEKDSESRDLTFQR